MKIQKYATPEAKAAFDALREGVPLPPAYAIEQIELRYPEGSETPGPTEVLGRPIVTPDEVTIDCPSWQAMGSEADYAIRGRRRLARYVVLRFGDGSSEQIDLASSGFWLYYDTSLTLRFTLDRATQLLPDADLAEGLQEKAQL